MTTRERIISAFLAAFILLAGVGSLYYLFYYSPMTDLDNQIKQTRTDLLGKKELLAREVAKNKTVYEKSPRLEPWQALSLPAAGSTPPPRHNEKLQAEYQQFLDEQFRKAGFGAGTAAYKITAAPLPRPTATGPAGRGVARPGAKGPPYTTFTYTVDTVGSYSAHLKALEAIYRAPVLHDVRRLTIEKPEDPKGKDAVKTGNLKGRFVVEVLQVEGALPRATTIPPIDALGSKRVLARDHVDYEKLLTVDMFTGKAKNIERLSVAPTWVRPYVRPVERLTVAPTLVPRTVPTKTVQKESVRDVLGVVKLTDVTNNGVEWYATYYNQGTGKEQRISLEAGELLFKDRYDNVFLKGKVVNISTTHGVYFKAADDLVYFWGTGDFLSEALENPLGVVAEGNGVILLKGVANISGVAIMSWGEVEEPFPPRPALGYQFAAGLGGLVGPSVSDKTPTLKGLASGR